MKRTVCTVKVIGWDSALITMFQVVCPICDRIIGTFSQHESAMAWAHAHAVSSKHIPGEEGM